MIDRAAMNDVFSEEYRVNNQHSFQQGLEKCERNDKTIAKNYTNRLERNESSFLNRIFVKTSLENRACVLSKRLKNSSDKNAYVISFHNQR